MTETPDWRAVCGKTARTVRREGRPKAFPTPISRSLTFTGVHRDLIFLCEPPSTQKGQVTMDEFESSKSHQVGLQIEVDPGIRTSR